nr:protein doublesex [Reticulitermes speratus]
MNTTDSGFDPGTSAASTSNSLHNTNTNSSFQNLRTKPTCARCRNHYILIPVKGHKRSCEFRNCTCFKCHVVAEGGKLRAIQLAIWRAVERDRKAKKCEKEKQREPDRDTPSETESDKYRETATPAVPGTDSHSVADCDVLPALYGCYSAQNLSINAATNASRNIIQPPQLENQLPRRYNQYFENYRPVNTTDTIVDPVTPQQLSYRPQISGKTQPNVPTAWMSNPSFTILPPQPKLQLSIPCGETFTNSGPLTTTAALVTDICSIKGGSDSLSSSGYTSGRTLPIDPSTSTNIARSTIQPPQRYLQLPPSCCHNFTNHVSQPHAAPPRTDLLSMIDGSGSLSSSGSTSNTTVPIVPSVCMNTPICTIPPPSTTTEFSLLCSNKFTHGDPLNIVDGPGTDFRSIDSLSSSFTSKSSRTLPVIPSAWMNVARPTLPPRQPVTRPSQWSCGSLPSYGAAGTSYYENLIRHYDLNSRYLNGS